MSQQRQAISPIKVLTFRKGNREATVCTYGLHYATYDSRGRKWHKSLTAAIAYLEGRGYKIIVDLWT